MLVSRSPRRDPRLARRPGSVTSRMPNVIRSRDAESRQFARSRRNRGRIREKYPRTVYLTAHGPRGPISSRARNVDHAGARPDTPARIVCTMQARNLETTDCKAIFIIPRPPPHAPAFRRNCSGACMRRHESMSFAFAPAARRL